MKLKNIKLNQVVLIGLLCGIFLPIVVSYIIFVNSYKEKSLQTMDIIANTVKISATEAMWFFSEDWAKIVVNTAVKNPKVHSVTLLNNDNVSVAYAKEKQKSTNLYEKNISLEKNGEYIGKLKIEFNIDEITKDIYIEKNHLLLILIFQAIIALAIVYLILKNKVLNPVKRLIVQAKLLSSKILDEEFKWEQKDEIGDLGTMLDETRISLKKMFQDIEDKLVYDNLTQAHNRNGFETIFENETVRCHRYKHPLSVIMFDIDYFKNVNDTYGHLAGDNVLKQISQLISSHIRKSDYLVRWGGEEFLIITPETSFENALILAEHLRVLVSKTDFEKIGSLTISLSVAQKLEEESTEDFLKKIDDLLYESKRNGRNMISY